MKIITIESGRVARLFSADEIRPQGGINVADFIRQTKERYAFSISPSEQAAKEQGAFFQSGRLIASNQKYNIGELKIYNDGVAVTAMDTDAAEYILNDVITWGKDTFGIREPITKPRTLYESNLVVEFDPTIERALRAFEQFRPLLENHLRQTYEQELPVHLSRIGLGFDPLGQPFIMRNEFGLERRINRPYSENRFFSIAPLKTRNHIELLETFERLSSE